jgi:hypothetical protein
MASGASTVGRILCHVETVSHRRDRPYQSDAWVLREIQTAGLPGDAVARLEGRHRSIGGNALRADVLATKDGLVSNLSLGMGVAGA